MKFRSIAIISLFAFFAVTLITCKKDNSTEETVLSARDQVLQDYKNIYLASNSYTSAWSGNTASCTPGTVSDDFQNKTIQRINYFRNIVGLPSIEGFNAAKNTKCQQGALMCQTNKELNHKPPSTWTCYTADGYQATSHSNLAMGATGPGAVTLYINDFGSGNAACGHRRWILYPRMKIMGHGSTSGYDCLMTLSETGSDYSSYPANMPEFISWPPKNYVPAPLVFGRWSFSIPSANFNSTTVTMTDGANNNIPLTIVSYKDNGYGDNTIIWEPTGIITNSKTDVTYNVKVNNVIVSSIAKNYEYNVIIVKPATKKKAEESQANFEVL